MGNNSTVSNSTPSVSPPLSALTNHSSNFSFSANYSSNYSSNYSTNFSSNFSANYGSNYSNSFPSGGFSLWFLTWTTVSVTDMLNHCVKDFGAVVYVTLKIIILMSALPANCALMWLLLKSRHNLSPSQLLGLNVSILDILFCLHLPLDVYVTLQHTSEHIHNISQSLSALNYFGCPLLLTLMCLERFVAVAFPITYLRLGKWEYRIMMCILAWIWILCVSVLAYFFQSLTMHLAIVVVIIALFLIMLVCLVGIVWVLQQKGPGDGIGRSDSLKKQALKNVLMVTVPAVIAYSPLVIVMGFIAEIINNGAQNTPEQCSVLQFLLAFPNLGLFIGPLFYLSRIRQIICCKTQMENTASKTQTE